MTADTLKTAGEITIVRWRQPLAPGVAPAGAAPGSAGRACRDPFLRRDRPRRAAGVAL